MGHCNKEALSGPWMVFDPCLNHYPCVFLPRELGERLARTVSGSQSQLYNSTNADNRQTECRLQQTECRLETQFASLAYSGPLPVHILPGAGMVQFGKSVWAVALSTYG